MIRGFRGARSLSPEGSLAALTFALCICLSALTAQYSTVHAAGIEGLSYSLDPGFEYVQWNDDIGLDEDALYGGRLGINFGRFVALRGFYFANTDVDITGTGDAGGVDLGQVDIANYGGDLALHFPNGSVLPFLYAGGGIYRFDPTDGDRIKKIGLRLGGGLRFSVSPRVEATVYAEDAILQSGTDLFPGPGGDSSSEDREHSLALGASLNFLLGGYEGETATDKAYLSEFSGGITGASWRLEPFAGKLNFESGLNLDDTELLGARMGFGFGPYIDLRGYYWRGVNEDFDESVQLQSYGGEAMFNLNPSPGVEPYIILGVGSLDFMSGYTNEEGMAVEDELMLIAGLGLDLTLSDRWRINLGARDHIFGPSELEETSDPDELFHNWMYSAGVSFTLGSGMERREPRAPARPMVSEAQPQPEAEAEPKPETAAEPKTAAEPEPEAAAPRPEAVAEVKASKPAPPPAPTVKTVVETVVVKEQITPPEWMASPVRTYQGDKVVTMPIPTVGEVYIRYGEPGGVSIESKAVTEETGERAPARAERAFRPVPEVSPAEEDAMRSAVREAIRQELAKARADWMSATADSLRREREALESLEDRLMRKIDQRIEDKVEREVSERGPTTVVTPSPTVTPTPAAPVTVVSEKPGGTGLVLDGGKVYTGANLDDPSQWVIGGRLSFRREGGTWPIYYVPELAFGFVDATSTLISASVLWDLSHYFDFEGYRPYVTGGVGLLFFSKEIADRDKAEGVLNLSYGVSKDFGRFEGFVEHQGVDLYSLHRLLIGVSWEL